MPRVPPRVPARVLVQVALSLPLMPCEAASGLWRARHGRDSGTHPPPPRGPLAPAALAALLPPPEAIDQTRPPGLRNAQGAAPSRSEDAHRRSGGCRMSPERRQSLGLASPRASPDLVGSVSTGRLLPPGRGNPRPGDGGAALPTQGVTDALGGGAIPAPLSRRSPALSDVSSRVYA
jgi:hypothetical protein